MIFFGFFVFHIFFLFQFFLFVLSFFFFLLLFVTLDMIFAHLGCISFITTPPHSCSLSILCDRLVCDDGGDIAK